MMSEISEIDFELAKVDMNISRRRPVFTVSEKVWLQKLVLQYKIHSKHLSIASRKIAWARLTQEFNSAKGFSRTEAQLKKCWDNIKTRRKQVLDKQSRSSRSQSLEDRQGSTQDEGLEHLASDPLMPVKQETPSWNDVRDDDSDMASKDFAVAAVSLEDAPSCPREPSGLADEELSPLPTRTREHLNCGTNPDRCKERIEELHKLKVAEQVWTLKTLRERHATAQLDRQRAHDDSEKAKLDLEKARLERDTAEFQREKALLELEQTRRADKIINDK